jgi:hypothetical protein
VVKKDSKSLEKASKRQLMVKNVHEKGVSTCVFEITMKIVHEKSVRNLK